MCKCYISNTILAVIILVFALWDTWKYSKWVVVIAAALLLIHEWMHKHTYPSMSNMNVSKKKKR